MSKAVLISMQPKWCEKICHKIGVNKDGTPIYEKRVEVRKTRPKLDTPFPVILHIDIINPTDKHKGDYEYKRIIGYAKEIKEPNGEIQYTVKLEDKGGYSIVYADPKDIRLKV